MKLTSSFKHDGIQGFKFGSWPFGKPKLFVHTFFVDGLLIDTGHSNMRKEVMQTLSPLEVNQIFITHHHEDHSGNLIAFQNHFKCPTYASSLCVELMKNPPPISFAQWLAWGKTAPNFNIIPEDKTINTPNHQFDLIPIPGHAIDMLGLYEKNKGWLFSGDLFVNDYIRYFMRNESMATQIESIKKVLKLDFEILMCNHNPQLNGGKKRLQNKLNFFEDLYGKVSDLHQKGFSVNAIIKALKIKRSTFIRILSTGNLSTVNMIKSIIRDEQLKEKNYLST